MLIQFDIFFRQIELVINFNQHLINHTMPLNVGLISAFVLFKNRPGAMTRLQKLQKQLLQKPIATITLYSYPLKTLFSICFILCFMACLWVFLREYELELHQKYQLQAHETLEVVSKINNNDTIFHTLHDRMEQFPYEMYHQYLNVESTVKLIVLFFTVPLLILIKSLSLQRLIVRKKQLGDSSEVSGHIEKQLYTILRGWETTQNILCQQNDIVFLQICGQQRFSNTNYHYAIKKVTKSDQQDKHSSNLLNQFYGNMKQKQTHLQQDVIITRGNVFEARKTLIYICHILGKEIKLNIKNAPTQQVKKKQKSKTRKRSGPKTT